MMMLMKMITTRKTPNVIQCVLLDPSETEVDYLFNSLSAELFSEALAQSASNLDHC